MMAGPLASRIPSLVVPLVLAGCGGPDGAADLFADATAASGIEFTLERPVAGDYFMPDSMGPGCALFDADGDEDLDLYVVCGYRDAQGRVVTERGANRLFLQQEDGRFVDATERSGAGHRGYGMGVAVGDVEGDGDLDLYVTNYGPDCLLLNDGTGRFDEATDAAGLANESWGSSAGFLDYDADGDLDLFVVNYLAYDENEAGEKASGAPEYASPVMFPGALDRLFENVGASRFREVSVPSGIRAAKGRGLGCVFSDLDGDGRLDIYVANDAGANFAWIQTEERRFVDRAQSMGLAVNAFGRPEASMGVAIGDADGDLDVDLFLTHLVRETNTFFRQTRPGSFDDDTFAAGLRAPSSELTGFGTAFLDVELDGDLDLIVVNGRVLRSQTVAGVQLGPHWAPYAEPNQLFLNDGKARFVVADACGALCADIEVSRGLAIGDVDDDGDLDAVVSNGNGTVRLYRNDAPRAGGWLRVRALDPTLGRDAYGAIVEIEAGGKRMRRSVTPVRSYLSSSDPRAHFGLGPAESVEAVHVVWPDGSRESFPGGSRDRSITVQRGEGE
ncbi:MAG: CRTAC1 family protein [bacterium]|nr:CRTAC1 family protein [bacterium]